MTSQVVIFACLAIAALSGSVTGQQPCPTTEAAITQRCANVPQRQLPWLVTSNAISDPCCVINLGPLKLVETNESIVNPQDAAWQARFNSAGCATGGTPVPKGCFNPPAFYTQYSNVYTSDFRKGIPILSDNAQNATFATLRQHMRLLLKWSARIIPNIAEYLSQAYIRVAINSCQHFTNGRNDWSAHPEADATIELGGANRRGPTVGSEESSTPSGSSCNTLVRFPASLEEFFHTIHHVGMRELDPDGFIAITCLSARDTEMGIYSSWNFVEYSARRRRRRQVQPQMPSDPATITPSQRIQQMAMEFDNDWAYTVSLEYYISAVAVWMGLPLGDFVFTVNGNRNVSSRATIKREAPDLACLIARYFPDVGEQDGAWCADTRKTNVQFCNAFPGSCYCGNMTADYLGPALNRSACPTLKEIKEGSTFHNRTLPGNANEFQCRGCTVSDCDTDRGQQRTRAPNAGASNVQSAAGRTALSLWHAIVLATVALLGCFL